MDLGKSSTEAVQTKVIKRCSPDFEKMVLKNNKESGAKGKFPN